MQELQAQPGRRAAGDELPRRSRRQLFGGGVPPPPPPRLRASGLRARRPAPSRRRASPPTRRRRRADPGAAAAAAPAAASCSAMPTAPASPAACWRQRDRKPARRSSAACSTAGLSAAVSAAAARRRRDDRQQLLRRRARPTSDVQRRRGVRPGSELPTRAAHLGSAGSTRSTAALEAAAEEAAGRRLRLRGPLSLSPRVRCLAMIVRRLAHAACALERAPRLHDDDLRPDLHAVVKVDDIVVHHADAAR